MKSWQTDEEEPHEGEDDEEPESEEEEEEEADFPQKLFVTMETDQNNSGAEPYPNAALSLRDLVDMGHKPISVAEYVLNKRFKARLNVEVMERED